MIKQQLFYKEYMKQTLTKLRPLIYFLHYFLNYKHNKMLKKIKKNKKIRSLKSILMK